LISAAVAHGLCKLAAEGSGAGLFISFVRPTDDTRTLMCFYLMAENGHELSTKSPHEGRRRVLPGRNAKRKRHQTDRGAIAHNTDQAISETQLMCTWRCVTPSRACILADRCVR
jgi:hypothetical protein